MESHFPVLHARWMEELLGTPPPRESLATCLDCSMCKKLAPPHESDTEFNPHTKCCTYTPGIPNFLVGGILQDEDPTFTEGRQLFEEKAMELAITPYSIRAHWIYWVRYYDKTFGQSEQILCPYFIDRDGGLCGIYKYRNSRCSTWFCKYESGRLSLDFWRAVDLLLTVMEEELSKWCVRTIDLQRPIHPANWREAVWGVWVDREREWYKKCWELVSQMNFKEALEHAGELAHPLVDPIIKTFAALNSNAIPDRLFAGKIMTVPITDHLIRVRGYSKLDPIDLNRDLVECLPMFDGRLVEEVLAMIKDRNVELDELLLRKLFQHKVLVPESQSEL